MPPSPGAAAARRRRPARARGVRERPAGGSLSRRELLAAAGIDEKQLAELETFGLVRRAGRVYGRDALQVASAAAVLGRYGVEARHLRAVRAAAVEREISFIEQVVAPTLRQRNPEASEQAGRTAREIAAWTHAAARRAHRGRPGRGRVSRRRPGPARDRVWHPSGRGQCLTFARGTAPARAVFPANAIGARAGTLRIAGVR